MLNKPHFGSASLFSVNSHMISSFEADCMLKVILVSLLARLENYSLFRFSHLGTPFADIFFWEASYLQHRASFILLCILREERLARRDFCHHSLCFSHAHHHLQAVRGTNIFLLTELFVLNQLTISSMNGEINVAVNFNLYLCIS